VIIHVDMDAFFASVEQRDHPELRGKPVLVGGPSKRGVVAAASYEARAFGVRSAMPMVEALRRCPQAVVVGSHHGHYAEVSADVFAIFGRFTPLVEGLSLDEAFLDVTASARLFGDGKAIAEQIRAAIQRELHLTASAGVAPGKFAAKVGSDLKKPNGLVVVPGERPQDVAAFLAPLPIERMWGIGPVAAARMHEAGFSTIGDLARASPNELSFLLGSWGHVVHGLACGIDERPVEPHGVAKSVGAEETFEHDVRDVERLRRALLAQSARVAERLFGAGLLGDVVTIKVKYADFTQRTARLTLREPVMDTDAIFAAASVLLDRMALAGRPVRLTGVAVSGLGTGPVQRSLFGDALRDKREAIEATTAKIRERFGRQSLTRATLLPKPDDE
jgi:DNA polymerase-4